MAKKEQKLGLDPKQLGVNAGALPWLVAFANLSIDDGNPRPPTIKREGSRSLGYRWRDYGFNADENQTIELSPAGDVITQSYRGILQRWLRRPNGQLIPILDTPPLITPETFAKFMAECPARAVMPLPAEDLQGAIPWHVIGESETEVPGISRILFALTHIRDMVRHDFLEPIWTGHQRGADPQLVHAGIVAISTLIECIEEYCIWDNTARALLPARQPLNPPQPAAADGGVLDNLDSMVEDTRRAIQFKVWTLRSPVRTLLTPKDALCCVAISFPGIVWAEVMNVYFAKHELESLRCCGWCGTFFLGTLGTVGRPRDYCSESCAKRFSARGAGDEP